MIIDRKYRNNL